MTVTEIAILRVHAGVTDSTLRDTLGGATPIQEAWHARTFPDRPSSASARAVACFRGISDETQITITTNWGSVEEHWQWILSDDNKQLMEGSNLTKIIANEGPPNQSGGLGLFHLDTDIFGNSHAATSKDTIALLDSPVIGLERFVVDAEKKEIFAETLEKVKASMAKVVQPHLVKSGHVADREADGEEFMLVSGWSCVESHTQEFAASSESFLYGQLAGIASSVETQHYRRFL
ncbi:hypothetical protein SMACR_03090 [Sordaria macrospora]|uniref:WGS project CABT00000000 data, contig 2.7 n=2 Tax=Sordaria macrospora TaxID=5147 RepID=F7VU93_SORMK|nr:uncharacterized protein SMAC_03090 [Sordaria macrospora k-hell]KAA8628075.1 hypothetical protein SMACR_03090 [Sordaria macrospora]KAH7632879.1 hypothetical protein B0T09DRAFT_256996 [Sordaria sp. MPI-SDFR-AT-0083]WPJ60658.1 hypothetical protein SMAC4_03090 [Sordaria macrospora]CCC09081.1 unnamed protein product [Sordaria macrospora k-hell]